MQWLLSFQRQHVETLCTALRTHTAALDASDTGTGKTYTTVAVCLSLGLRPLILCPKSVMPSWRRVLKEHGVTPLGISNYEMVKGCKWYRELTERDATLCPHIIRQVDNDVEPYRWELPTDGLLVFDEAHRCKNTKSVTSKLALARGNCRRLLLSATLADRLVFFKPFGVVLGLYERISQYRVWMSRQKFMRTVGDAREFVFDREDREVLAIHAAVFPEHGSRMRIADLGDAFPQNQVVAQAYHLDKHDEIDVLYAEINVLLRHLRDRELRATALGRIIILLQRIEILKMPIFLDLIEDALENGFSVAVFVKFRETLQQICHMLKCDTAIYGTQTAAERQACIDDFQANRRRLLVATIQAGGVGISLHDTTGSAPRMSIISPTWSAQDMVQTLGRIHRAGAKTPACQRIVFVANTWEERICEIIEKKITNLHGLNDGDLIGLDVTRQDIGELMGVQQEDGGGGGDADEDGDPEPPSSEKVVWLR